MNATEPASLRKQLIKWYLENRRDLPWRRSNNPYHIWVSEVMLQQTQVNTVVKYYGRFLKTFPNIKKLAQADLQDVLKVWEGMGYYAGRDGILRPGAKPAPVSKGCRKKLQR
jgi:A/G-specific adenine glycosylase